MLAMVLAVGLLVDDAIVVVENVERVMSEHGLTPREATRQSMDEISGALVGIALVLPAVFLPMAFFSGSTRVIANSPMTIISAMALSVLIALILAPALCATLPKSAALLTGIYADFSRLIRPPAGSAIRPSGWRPWAAPLGEGLP
jgi:multidrug efflux pump